MTYRCLEREYRCECGRLLFKGILIKDSIEIKCPKCGKIQNIPNNVTKEISKEYLKYHYRILIDKNGFIKKICNNFSEITGYGDEVIGLTITKINSNLGVNLYKKIFELIQPLDPLYSFETIHMDKNGKFYPVIANFKKIVIENQEYLYDIVKLCDNNISFKKNKNVFFTDFDLQIGLNLKITLVDNNVENLFGYKMEDLLGKNMLDFVKSKARKNIESLSKTESSFRINDIQIKCAKGFKKFDLFFLPSFSEINDFIGYKILGWFKK